jgi:hypothetical protein
VRRLLGLGLLLLLAGCSTSRVIISTGTTIGLKATPGDGNTRPPQITFGYKRAEASIVPTKGVAVGPAEDAFSTLAAFHFQTRFFGRTELDSFISTGDAALEIQQQPEFQREIREAALRAEAFRTENRSQRDIAIRITELYRATADKDRRGRIRGKAEELGLVPAGTTDEAFEQGRLVGSAVGGRPPVTKALQELERFTASVLQ